MTGALVIAHRGASGHRPEHTALAYRLAWRQGADSVETDVVATRDGVLVCRHDLELSRTTDVAERPELASRRRTMFTGGRTRLGWFVQDLDLEELKRLRARERWPRRRRESARYDDHVGVVTLEELLRMREEESARAGRELRVHIELKEPDLFATLGMPLEEPLVDLLRRHRLASAGAPATVMSFDADALAVVRAQVDTRQVRLFDRVHPVRRRELERVAAYAEGVGLHKDLVLQRGPGQQTTRPGKAVGKAMAAGLDVLVWTLRSENKYLPADLRVGSRGKDHGDAGREVERFLDLGVDGLVTDFPALAVQVRAARAGAVAL